MLLAVVVSGETEGLEAGRHDSETLESGHADCELLSDQLSPGISVCIVINTVGPVCACRVPVQLATNSLALDYPSAIVF